MCLLWSSLWVLFEYVSPFGGLKAHNKEQPDYHLPTLWWRCININPTETFKELHRGLPSYLGLYHRVICIWALSETWVMTYKYLIFSYWHYSSEKPPVEYTYIYKGLAIWLLLFIFWSGGLKNISSHLLLKQHISNPQDKKYISMPFKNVVLYILFSVKKNKKIYMRASQKSPFVRCCNPLTKV